jgi:hypothetical protein
MSIQSVHSRVESDSDNKLRLFPHKTLIDRFLTETLFTARYGMHF